MADRFLFASSYAPTLIGELIDELEAARAACPASTGQTWLDFVNARQDALIADGTYTVRDAVLEQRAPERYSLPLRWRPNTTPLGQRLRLIAPPQGVAAPTDVRLQQSLPAQSWAEIELPDGRRVACGLINLRRCR